jgi:hypothetical protein
MAEGLSEIQFRGTPMLALTLFVVTALPCAGAAAAPSAIASSVSAVGRPVQGPMQGSLHYALRASVEMTGFG